jgi:hypothetical protein
MPFKIGNKTIQLDTPFTIGEGNSLIQYPANFLRLSTEEEKSALGITWEADPVRASDVFYWDGNINNPKELEDKEEVDENGNPMYVKVLDKTDPQNPVMVDSTERLVTKGLKSNFIAQIKNTAGTILAQTDWMVIRKAERNVDIPTSVATYRASVVTKATELEASISAVTTVEQLIALDLSFPSDK